MSKLDKNVDKSFRLSKKSYIVTLVATLFITLISASHGITETWAWEIAKTLITVDGLILGFIIFGATMLVRRGFTQASYESMIEQTVDKLLKQAGEYEKSKKPIEEFVKEEYAPIWSQAFYQFGYQMTWYVESIKYSLYWILTSIGFAFCLFGVSIATIDSLSRLFFILVHYVSVFSFIFGVYLTQRVVTALVEKTALEHIEKPSAIVARILEKRAKNSKESGRDRRNSRTSHAPPSGPS